jgi:hypothetical protein
MTILFRYKDRTRCSANDRFAQDYCRHQSINLKFQEVTRAGLWGGPAAVPPQGPDPAAARRRWAPAPPMPVPPLPLPSPRRRLARGGAPQKARSPSPTGWAIWRGRQNEMGEAAFHEGRRGIAPPPFRRRRRKRGWRPWPDVNVWERYGRSSFVSF